VVSQTQHSTYNIFLASGKTWHFHAWTLSGSMYLDDYKEFSSGAIVTPDERMQFTYDSLDRLTQALTTTINGYTGTYTYNPIGNLISKSEGVGAINYTYGVTQPHAVRSLSNGGLYQYDANGNMSLRVELSGSQRITYTQQWDSENRLNVVTNTLTSQVSKFIYDADGARVMQLNIIGTQVMTTAYAGAIEVQITATQRITKAYYSAGSQLIAMRVITASGSALYFMSSDHLGSASLTTDANGGFVARQKFDAWGNVRASASSGSMGTDIGYTSQRLDATGLMFYHARYYSAYLNRWIQPDTIVPDFSNPQSLNRYSYTRNNPLKYIDPSGHKEIECEPGTLGCDLNGQPIKKSTLPRQFEIGQSNSTRAIEPPARDAGYICSPAALFVLLRYYGLEDNLNDVLDAVSNPADETLKPGALDPGARAGERQCLINHVCTSLQVIKYVAMKYAGEQNVVAGEDWTKERIMQSVVGGNPVMVNYGGGPDGGYGHSVIIYGYDLDVGTGGKFMTLDPLLGGKGSFQWDNSWIKRWGKSDYRDPLRQTPGGFNAYHNWALVINP
jgi:RHS repeat-associated protein